MIPERREVAMSKPYPLGALGRFFLDYLALTTGIVGVLFVLFLWLQLQTAASLVRNIPWGFLLTASITAVLMLLVSVAGRLVHDRHPLVQWGVYVPTFAAAGAVGPFLATAVLYGAGAIASDRAAAVALSHLRGTIPITVALGTFFMTVAMWKARVHSTEVALREQEIERERAERLATEAQLASLSARVQPHFLFNTLNSIAALVHENPRQAEQMVEQLSAVLRSSLDTAIAVPLEREMKLVDDYLDIQRVRFGERLRFSTDWDPIALRDATVPPFAVQTLVENVVKHVAAARPDGVVLQVRASQSRGATVIEVIDDGGGFEPQALRAGHGLDNLQRRLRSVYAGGAALEFERSAGRMVVRLRVPQRP